MSSTKKGAASAAPTLNQLADGIREDLAAIEGDNRSALQHAIAAGEKLNEAKAQMAHGEWLPWLAKNFGMSQQTASKYSRLANYAPARNFNSVREALAAIPAKKRKTEIPKTEPRETQVENDDVVAWVARRMKAGKTREEAIEESKTGAHDWPLAEPLKQNNWDICKGIVKDRKRRGDNTRRRQPRESGKRLRELHAEKRAGRSGDLWNLQKAIASAVSELEYFDLPVLDWSEETEILVLEIFDDLERHARWNDQALAVVAAHMDDLGRQRKIQALRVRADDPSSTQSERETAARLADRLRQKRNAQQLVS